MTDALARLGVAAARAGARRTSRSARAPRSSPPSLDLGLVVVDEEHDASYKHEGDPRYDARHVAARRAVVAGADGSARRQRRPVLLAGSATPRPETWARLPHLTLPDRVGSRPLPPVEVLDMRGAGHPLHPVTHRALTAARKAILLLNRRGWSNFLTCRTCGKVWECPQCDVALVLHRAEHALTCHHCGHRERVPDRCDACGSPSVARYGAGTERLVLELAEALDVPVFRLDADTAAAKDAVPELLARFAAAPAGLLVGTQMVAKGHDFPDVTLGVVVDADSTLRFPDFRAEERTFALIAQLAGRAGRGPRGGRVLVQTTAPDAPAIVAAARHDTPGFVAGELERRRALDYPPFADLIRVVCTAQRARRRRAPPRARWPTRRRSLTARRCSGRCRPSASAAATAGQVVVKAHDRAAAIGAVREAATRAGDERAYRERRLLSRRRPARNSAGMMAEERVQDEREPADHLDPETRARREAALQAGAQVRRSRAAEPRARDRPVRRHAARRDPPDGTADGRLARHRSRRHAGRRDAPRARLPRRERG